MERLVNGSGVTNPALKLGCILPVQDFSLLTQHFIRRNFKHIEQLKELYSEHPFPTTQILQLLAVCYTYFVTYLFIHLSLQPSIHLSFFDAFQRDCRVQSPSEHFSMPIINQSSNCIFQVKFTYNGMHRTQLYHLLSFDKYNCVIYTPNKILKELFQHPRIFFPSKGNHYCDSPH